MVDDLLNALEQLGQKLHANKIKKVYDQKISSHQQCERCNKGRIGPKIKFTPAEDVCKLCLNAK